MGIGDKIVSRAADSMLKQVNKSVSRAVVSKVENKIVDEVASVQDKLDKEKRRANSTCDFSEGISSDEFGEIAIKACKYTKRVYRAWVEGPVVYAQMKSNTGRTRYHFNIDFNDYGHITGRYWIRQYNKESGIPEEVAEKISREIKKRIGSTDPMSKMPIDPEVEFVETAQQVGAVALMGVDILFNSPKQQEKRRVRQEKSRIRQEKVKKANRIIRIFEISVVAFIILISLLLTYS